MAVSYKSDYIRPTGKGGGRPFDTHGARFDNGMVFVNEGLSHEENPNGGVQVGVDGKGKPNLVEQGEVIVDLGGGPYVMSQRLRLGREDLLMAGLPVKYAGKTCAEAATGMQRESEERPLDEISMRGLRAMLERLAAVQETYRDDIGASGTQNLNLGQDLYGARAQAVGNEEEMGQMPIESEAEEGYAAYGGWSLKKNDMTPYGYYNYGSIPGYGDAPRYDGYENIPIQMGEQLGGPYVGVPIIPRRYPAAYPYPTAPMRRQMAYGGYRFAGDEPDTTGQGSQQTAPQVIPLGNGSNLVFNSDGTSYIVDENGNTRAANSQEINDAIALARQRGQTILSIMDKYGKYTGGIDASTNLPSDLPQETQGSSSTTSKDKSVAASCLTGAGTKSKASGTETYGTRNSQINGNAYVNSADAGNIAGVLPDGTIIFAPPSGPTIDVSTNAPGTNSANVTYRQIIPQKQAQ